MLSRAAEESRIAVCAVLVVRAVGDDHIAVWWCQRRIYLVVKVADGEFGICPTTMAHIVAPENDQTRFHFRTIHCRTEHGGEVVAIITIMSVSSHKQGRALCLHSTHCRVVFLAARCQHRAMAANKDGGQHPKLNLFHNCFSGHKSSSVGNYCNHGAKIGNIFEICKFYLKIIGYLETNSGRLVLF